MKPILLLALLTALALAWRLDALYRLDPARPADMQFELACRPEQARELVAQLGNIVEVMHVWSEETPMAESATSPANLAAA